MNIEETLAQYSSLHHEYEKALQQCRTLELKMQSGLYDNEEPYLLTYLDGQPSHIKIKTPNDVADITTGCVIAIGGAEWFRADGYWLSCYGTKKDDREMFIRIMRNRNLTHLIHKSY